MSVSRVLLLTRQNCTLCAEAERTVQEICDGAGVGFRVVDVDDHAELRSRYTDHVPVVFVDQELHGYWFVDAQKLSTTLGREASPMPDDWLPTHIPV